MTHTKERAHCTQPGCDKNYSCYANLRRHCREYHEVIQQEEAARRRREEERNKREEDRRRQERELQKAAEERAQMLLEFKRLNNFLERK